MSSKDMCDDDLPSAPVTNIPPAGNGASERVLSPLMRTAVPGPESKSWLLRLEQVAAPMGPKRASEAPFGTVFARSEGCNVWDVDDNRFVDLAAGFGSMLLGHSHPRVLTAIELQSRRLMQAMGDLYPSDAKVALMRRLVEFTPWLDSPQCIVGQSGADALTAAMKTATLHTGRTKFLALETAYHGLSYGPLAACGLRSSYREPFTSALQPEVEFLPLPEETSLGSWEKRVEETLATGKIAAALIEPIVGRGGVYPLSAYALESLQTLAQRYGTLTVADEVWTALGRAGDWLASTALDFKPDLVCLGKGLGGGLPISAVLGDARVMKAWSRDREVVHTSTFAGAPLACAAALSTINAIERQGLVEHARQLGQQAISQLRASLSGVDVQVRGRGLMIGLELGGRPGTAVKAMQRLLAQGYITSTGGGTREVLVLTPPLTITETALFEALSLVAETVSETVRQ